MGITAEEREFWVSRGFKDPEKSYRLHQFGAKSRGIAFTLTFDEWWELWAPYWAMRGTKAHQYQMCRNRDTGGYEPGNVRIDTQKNNSIERGSVRKEKKNKANLPGNPKNLPRAKRTGGRMSTVGPDWSIGRQAFAYMYQDDEQLAEIWNGE